jgi:hypothetical protein
MRREGGSKKRKGREVKGNKSSSFLISKKRRGFATVIGVRVLDS